MLRLIGILTGSAIAVAFLIVALGPPRLAPPADAIEATADEAEKPAAQAIPRIEPGPLQEPTAPLAAEPIDESPEIPLTDAQTEALIEEIFSPQPQPVGVDVTVADMTVTEDNWYAFWSPFRSEIAARGFIAKLQETTGIDYRVVKVKTGVYEVAFAYEDDADIQDKLARISNATGLDMTGG